MIDWKPVQTRLGVKVDGDFGPLSWTALLVRVAGQRAAQVGALGMTLAAHADAYGLTASAERVAQFIGECAHESGSFVYLREVWGPTAAQRAYDAPGNKLGNKPGDGFALRGAGPIQVTGRNWFDKIGHRLGLDLIGNSSLLNQPTTAMLVSLEWWALNGMNALADTGDTLTVARTINLGNPRSTRMPNGYASRLACTNAARAVMSGPA